MNAKAETLLSLFRGRAGVVAVANDDGAGFHPHRLDRAHLPVEWFERRHLAGERCLGFYLSNSESRVLCSCTDFDANPAKPEHDPEWQEKAVKVALFLVNVGVQSLVEVSQSGLGAHVWIFFDVPTDAWLVRTFWRVVEQKTNIVFKEIYPRQDWVAENGIGNLVRYPLWNKSHFVEPEEWTDLPFEALAKVERTSAGELKEIALRLGVELKPSTERPKAGADGARVEGVSARVQERLEKKGTLLARRWAGDTSGMKDESKSALAMAIATELVRQFIPTPEIEAALRHWCAEQGCEKGDRPDWIARTVSRAYEFVLSRFEEKSATTSLLPDACHAYLDMLERGQCVHTPSGIIELDQSIDGVAAGEMAVIAARPGHGKTAFGMQWVDNAAGQGVPCLVVSEEMSATQLGQRALLSFATLEQKSWEAEAAPLLRRDIDRHYKDRAPIHVVENCNTIDRCEDVIDQHATLHGVKLVMVDYLQLLGGKGQKAYERVTDVSRRLKQTARRNSVVLLALCQLNRDIDARPGREPRLSDLRESGQLEQDADVVIFLQWPSRFDPKAGKEEFRLFVAKRRNGPVRQSKIVTVFNPEKQRVGGCVRG
jgi:KaiC/GvpD/RAD55 family RecA-like ATPase